MFFFITQLVKPLGNVPAFTEPDRTVPIEPQLPSAVAVSRELILTSNGEGDIELVGIEEREGKILGTSLGSVCYMGTGDEGIQPVPCVLLTARQVKDKILLVVYSRTSSKSTEFHIATLYLTIPNESAKRLEDGSFALTLTTLHIQKGTEVPSYCSITPSGEKVIFASETRHNKVRLEGDLEEVEPMEVVQEEPKRLYQWSQEGADITVQFDLPSHITKSAINCKFVVDHLSLLIKDTNISYPFRKLWSTVKSDECVWTLENNKLTLFMTKADEHTRWPQLFDNDDGVLETISPEAIAEIRNRLDKFTSDEDSNKENPFAQPAQHPAATDMDEDIDEGGLPILFNVYDNATGNVVEEFSTGNLSWSCKSFDAPHQLPSVCLQMDVDGLIFTLTEANDTIKLEHVCTLDAFGFVQASKRDARFTAFDPHFHFASIIESSRNAYVYYHHNDKRTMEAQTLVDLTKGYDVNIIGAQLLLENILMVLTESESIVIIL